MSRRADNLTIGVFAAQDREVALALAKELTARNHAVSLHDSEAWTRRELPLRASVSRTAAIQGAGVVAATALAVFALLHLLGSASAPQGGLGWQALAVASVAALLGALASGLASALSPAQGLREAQRALEKPGRVALTVASGKARRPFLEARIATAGALLVSSV